MFVGHTPPRNSTLSSRAASISETRGEDDDSRKMEEIKTMIRSLQGDVNKWRKEMIEDSKKRKKEMDDWRAEMDEKVRQWQTELKEEIRKEQEAMQEEREATRAEREEWSREKERLSEWLDDTDRLSGAMKKLQEKIERMEEEAERRRRDEKRKNVVIFGMEETKTDKNVVEEMASAVGVEASSWEVLGRVGRQGRAGQRPRPVVARLRTSEDKKEVMRKKGQLKGSNVFVTDDLEPRERRMQKELRDAAAAARREGRVAKVGFGKLWIQGTCHIWTEEGIKVQGQQSSGGADGQRQSGGADGQRQRRF